MTAVVVVLTTGTPAVLVAALVVLPAALVAGRSRATGNPLPLVPRIVGGRPLSVTPRRRPVPHAPRLNISAT